MKTVKGSEIINHVTEDIRVKMPDIEQVRANCLNQKTEKISTKNNIQKKQSRFKPRRILAAAAALIFIVGLINIQVVIAAVGGFIEETSKFIENTFSNTSNEAKYAITVNTSPGNDDKFQAGGENMTYNLNTTQKENVIIQIYRMGDKGRGIEIATNAVVTMDKKKNIVIGGDTVIDRDGNVIESGSAACRITKSDGTVIEINPLLPHQDDSMTELAKAEYEESGISTNLIEMLPYMSQELIDEIAQNEYEKSGINALSDKIIPYISQNVSEAIAGKQYEINGLKGIIKLSRTISEDLLDEFALIEYKKNGFKNIPNEILVLLSKKTIDEIVLTEYETNGLKNFDYTVYPFASENTMDIIAKREYEKNKFNDLDFMMYPYISVSAIDEIMKAEYEKSGFKNFSVYIYSYISNAIIDELVVKEYEKSGFKNFPIYVYSYISNTIIDELAMKEYEKNGLDSLENLAPYMSGDFIEEIKEKEYVKTGVYPIINDNIGRHFTRTDNGLEIVETPFIGEARYVTVEENERTKEEITKVGKDGEYAEIYTKNSWESNGTARVTIKDGDKTAVVTRDADGLISVTVEQNGNSETTEINPELNPVMTIELNGKNVEVSQTAKSGTAYVRVTRGDVTARIKIAKKAEINVLDYLLTTPLYGT